MMFLSKLWADLHSPVGTSIVTTLFLISEAIGSSDKFKESAVVSYIIKALKFLKDKLTPSA